MSIGVLQERQASGTGSLVSSFSLAFSSNVSAGSAIHGLGAYAAGATPTITFSDNNSNNWGAGSLDTVTDTAGGEVTLHQVAQTLNAGACNVTLTFTGVTRDFPALWIKEIGGVTTTGNPDGHNGVTSASTTSQLISATNANQPALISVLSLNANTQETPVLDASLTASTANPGWDFGTGNKGGVAGHKRITSTGSQSVTNTQASADGLVTVMAIFVESGGGAATTTAWQRIRPLNPPGASPGKFGRFYQSPKSYAVATNVTAALTGQAATFASGSLTPGISGALSGQSATFTSGNLAPSTSLALNGQTVACAAGNLIPGISIALAGIASTFASGSLVPSVSIPLLGTQAIFTAGTVTVSGSGNVTVALTGQAATFSAGVLTANTSVAFLGVAASFAAGTLSPSSSIPVTGQGALFATGVVVPASSIALNGSSATFATGNLLAASSLALTGVSCAFAAGTLAPTASVALQGSQATFSPGNVSSTGDVTVALTGSRATFNAGIMTPSGGQFSQLPVAGWPNNFGTFLVKQ